MKENTTRTFKGQANHIFKCGDITNIEVNTLEFEDNRDDSFVTIKSEMGNESIIINSVEQWEQLNAIVKKAFRDIE